jgi:type I restriction enzyme R subunit
LFQVDKKTLSERDVCTKFITPALAKAGWDLLMQVRENVHLTKGRVIVRGKLVTRGTARYADYVLYARPNANVPPAIGSIRDGLSVLGFQGGGEYQSEAPSVWADGEFA